MPLQEKGNRSEFLKDFPWLRSLDMLYGDSTPNAPISNRQRAGRWNIDRYEVDVQRADATLMFRRSNDRHETDAILDTVRKREAEQAEYLAIVTEGSLTSSVIAKPRRAFERYAFQEVEYLVWITIQSWYEYKRPAVLGVEFLNQGSIAEERFFFERVMKVTVYKPPREGWAELYRTATLSDTVLTDSYIKYGVSRGFAAERAIQLKLEDMAKQFAAGPYASGLRKQILAAYEQGQLGMSSRSAAILLRSYVLSGCIFINLVGPSSEQVTFCGFVDEDEHRTEGLLWLGMNSWSGIYGSIPQVEQLLSLTESAWPMPSFKPRNIHGPF